MHMKTEDQIRADVTKQIVDGAKTQCNDQLAQIEKSIEDLYRTKIEQDVQDTMEIAETGCTNTSAKAKDQENKRFQQQLADLRFQKDAVERKLEVLDGFH